MYNHVTDEAKLDNPSAMRLFQFDTGTRALGALSSPSPTRPSRAGGSSFPAGAASNARGFSSK